MPWEVGLLSRSDMFDTDKLAGDAWIPNVKTLGIGSLVLT